MSTEKGNIYLAKVHNVAVSYRAAFVDYGDERDGFLPFDEIKNKYKTKKIRETGELIIRRDTTVLVQIKKEPTADKGALLTTFLSLSGKYVAYMPYGSPYGAVSRKIENTQEKNRLLQIANELASSENVRLIIRTEALGKSKEVIYQDLMQLKEKFLKIQQQAQQVVVPSLLYQGESSFIKKIVQGIRKFFRKK